VDGAFELGQVVIDGRLQDRVSGVEVAVGQVIAHAGDLAPGDAGLGVEQLGGQGLDRLADLQLRPGRRCPAAAGSACVACGTTPPGGKHMVCDELWSYEEQQGIATLSGVRILCPACDHARHFARAAQLGLAAEALRTLATVNGISPENARSLLDDAAKIWRRRRSRLAWTVQVSQKLLDRYAALEVLSGQRCVPGEGRSKVSLADRRPAM
jgi:hypothetical protein